MKMSHLIQIQCTPEVRLALQPYFYSQDGAHVFRVFGTSIAEATFTEDGIELTFPLESPMEELEALHNLLVRIDTHHDVTIEDSKAVIGYLRDGTTVTVYRQFKRWLDFLAAARVRSMEGVVVEVRANGVKLAEGVLRSYELVEDGAFYVSACTIEADGLEHFEGELALAAVM
ncbi:hypothetical protein EVJ20_09945 [Exiguobacterium sp. SH0S1]|nr:hypothetical protein EVJ29_11525 [Exiguobacterium sp. SH4S7]TCI52896.1 hypothetical protein EVJ24_10215 [Exiguobacterium sp. SH1S21]TCI60566.1 hypothetical protein EVJ21_11370 [Exiguobacterium sp. SH0S2]TCI77030.1 hypothetical protein EVJ20_09945 [Exiguobacterium sp. SH0S1]